MATLHIEHEITDFATWFGQFTTFAEIRSGAGVTAERVLQPIDDDKYIVVHLDFDTVDQAESFREFLETRVWAVPANSPALVGSPRAVVLDSPAS